LKTSKILKSLRAKRLLTQDDIALKLGITRQTYNAYENNPLKCDLNTLIQLVSTLKANDLEYQEFFNAIEQDFMSYIKKEN